jgi:ABC-type multidrug transport system fused ATPase/permease subunit
VLEFIENRKTIENYSNIIDNEKIIKDKFNKRDKHFKAAFAASAFGKTGIAAIKGIALSIFFILSILELSSGKMTISVFITLISYFSLVFIPLSAIQELFESINKFSMLKNRISENIDIHVSVNVPNSSKVSINDVSFSYEDKVILNNININVDKCIGLVGLSGEGKTTILKLITGDVLPSSGNVKMGNLDIFNISRALLFSSLRIYFQDTEIFDNDLNYNICLGKTPIESNLYISKINEFAENLSLLFNKIVSNKKNILNSLELNLLNKIYGIGNFGINISDYYDLIRTDLISCNIAERSAFLSDFLVSKEYYIQEKYDEIVSELELNELIGRDFGQRGQNISGGEKSRICLARFLIPENDGIYILDEPLTNVDIFLENKCISILKRYLKGKKGIIISHKLNIIKELVDEVILINDGSISESGSIDKLLENKKLFWNLYQKYTEQ